ncbi:MAG: DNA repair protein RadC [Deltaproteobacteria bacterium]|nr:MAG: DNA repair protein RadC [Deltaproteobacteria bacterium]
MSWRHVWLHGGPTTHAPERGEWSESRVKRGDVSFSDPVPGFRVSKFRVALVREGSIPTTWDKTVREPGDVARLMAPLLVDLDRETFWVVMLDGKNRVIGVNLVSVGSLNAALVHPRETVKALILSNSAAAILVHQHPSGSPEPSREDLALTERLRAVGDLLGIRILDHVILGHDGAFRSLADDGVLGGGR